MDGLIILDEEIENDDTKIGFVFQNPNDQIVMVPPNHNGKAAKATYAIKNTISINLN